MEAYRIYKTYCQMSRRVLIWFPAFWTIVFIELLSLLTPAAPELNPPFLVSESAFKE